MLTDDPGARFAPGARLYPEGAAEPLTVAEAWAAAPGWIIRFSEIPTRNAAAAFRVGISRNRMIQPGAAAQASATVSGSAPPSG